MKMKRYVPLFEEYDENENYGPRIGFNDEDVKAAAERSRELNKPKYKRYGEKGKESKSALELFVENAIEQFTNGYGGCYYYNLGQGSNGKDFAVVIGWQGGYDNSQEDEDSDCITDGDEYRVCMKLAYNCDDMQCDYDTDWMMPGGEDGGDVDDTDTCITRDVKETVAMAEDLIRHFNEYWK